MKVEQYPRSVQGTYTYQGHYFCGKCGEMIGFPHPDGKTKGIWRWNKKATKLLQVKHNCEKQVEEGAATP